MFLKLFLVPFLCCFLLWSYTLQGNSASARKTCSCGVRNPDGATKIIGGSQTRKGELPWRVYVSVNDSKTSHIDEECGGTIISRSWILTAAHCLDRLSAGDIYVYTAVQGNPSLGGGGTKNNVNRREPHPNYNSRDEILEHDIALLHLERPLTFSPNVSPVCLPFRMKGFSGIEAWASGWGATRPVPVGSNDFGNSANTLRKVKLPVLSTSECQLYLGKDNVTTNQICTYRTRSGTCFGDSGGSLDYENPKNGFFYAIGVVSSGNGCAQLNTPSVYTKVTMYLSWIKNVTGECFCGP